MRFYSLHASQCTRIPDRWCLYFNHCGAFNVRTTYVQAKEQELINLEDQVKQKAAALHRSIPSEEVKVAKRDRPGPLEAAKPQKYARVLKESSCLQQP